MGLVSMAEDTFILVLMKKSDVYIKIKQKMSLEEAPREWMRRYRILNSFVRKREVYKRALNGFNF